MGGPPPPTSTSGQVILNSFKEFSNWSVDFMLLSIAMFFDIRQKVFDRGINIHLLARWRRFSRLLAGFVLWEVWQFIVFKSPSMTSQGFVLGPWSKRLGHQGKALFHRFLQSSDLSVRHVSSFWRESIMTFFSSLSLPRLENLEVKVSLPVPDASLHEFLSMF